MSDFFDKAVNYVRTLPAEGPTKPSNETKLKFYANFKQATVGSCKEHGGAQPWAIKVEARAKWDAWQALGSKSAEEAKRDYVALLDSVDKDWRAKC